MEAEDAGDPGHTAEGREQRHGQLCAGHQPDGHGHSDAEQHLQCTGDDERRTQETDETDETTESTQVTGTTETQGTAATGTEALLEELSETFRTNPDSILMKLDELGLSLEDLGDEDNLASLATAMNEGAANMGLPTIEDLDSAVSTLHEKLSANWSSYFKVEEA